MSGFWVARLLDLGMGALAALVLASALFLAGYAFTLWTDKDRESPLWVRIIGALVTALPILTFCGWMLRTPQ